ncbi:MAG TPA: restriction endonuclease subunit R, partial [Myxococcales bacterium]|nr:restriction endonuclease subunit R [Myxococcales bacterium]
MNIGQLERSTQDRVARFFVDTLGYQHLGNFHHNPNNKNILDGELEHFLIAYQDIEQDIAQRAVRKLIDAANQSKSLYERNKDVYKLLRYGIKIKPEDQNHITVYPIDWSHPERNQFAIAEEVTVKPRD